MFLPNGSRSRQFIIYRQSATTIAADKSFTPCLLNSVCAQPCNPNTKLNNLSSFNIFLISSIKELNSLTYSRRVPFCLSLLKDSQASYDAFWGRNCSLSSRFRVSQVVIWGLSDSASASSFVLHYSFALPNKYIPVIEKLSSSAT